MNKKTFQRLRYPIIGILLLGLILGACNLPMGQDTQTPESQPPVEPRTATEAPIELAVEPPELGDTKPWVDGSLLVFIPPGEFVMGSPEIENNPEHVVYLDGFWIYRTEVTNRMYLHCMVKGECSPPAMDPSIPDLENPEIADHPVVGVRWDQAQTYCEFVGGSLPTEAQWEKTARGPDAFTFPWGEVEPNCEMLNFDACIGELSRVIDYPPGASPYEVLDMAGNVFEWVADWYQEDYFVDPPFDNPLGPDYGEARSVRGSTFNTGPDQVASALRYFLEPDDYRLDLSFRCVVANAQEFAPSCEVLAYGPPDALADNPDDPPGGSAECIVPQPQIDVVTYCENGTRGNNISWAPADADVNYSSHEGVSCSMYDADTLTCVGNPGSSVFIEVCKSCPPPHVELGVLGSCDPPYDMDEVAGICQYTGPPMPGAGLCTPGHALDPDGICCEVNEGDPLDFPICPVGGRFDPTPKICWFTLPSTGDKKCDNQTVYFDPCPRPPDDDDDDDDDDDEPVDPCNQYSTAGECGNHKDQCYWDTATVPEVCRSRP